MRWKTRRAMPARPYGEGVDEGAEPGGVAIAIPISDEYKDGADGRGLHLCQFQLNLSSSVHGIIQLNS
jgi:hypothetical protein